MAGKEMNGVWKFHSSDQFDEYMKALGVSMPLRKMGNLAKPTLTITIDEKTFSFISNSTFRNIKFSCAIDEDFDEETPDGRKCKSRVKWVGDKLVQTQCWDGKTTTITRYLSNGDLVNDCEMEGILCRRIYKKQAKA